MPAQREVIVLGGGLDYDTSPLQMQPGRLVRCLNYEQSISDGYTRMEGMERYDGQPSPSDGVNLIDPLEDTSAARRALITAVPGEGPVRGITLYRGDLYAFRDNVGQTEVVMHKATPAGWTTVTTPTLNAAGRYEFVVYNFEGGSGAEVLLGVSGTNKAFQYDGTTYTEIDIEGDANFPTHISAMNNYCFLGQTSGNLYWSAVGDPTDFTIAGGAGFIGVGATIRGLHEATGGSLVVRMDGRVSVLTGNSPTNWANRELTTNDESVGGEPYSAVQYGNWYYLDERGIMEFGTTDQFGDFASNLISLDITEWLASRTKTVVGTVINKSKRQIRWFFNNPSGSDNTDILTMRFGPQGLSGFTTQKYPVGANAVCYGNLGLASPVESMFIGANDGFVYQLDKGTSFDGEDIESYLQFPFWHLGTPQLRKNFKRIVFTTEINGEATLQMRPYFNYQNPDAARHNSRLVDISGGGSIWDQPLWDVDDWNNFFWASQPVKDGRFDVTGTGANMSVIIYNKSQSAPFTLYEALVQYKTRGLYR